ncbi:MAG: UDP-2,3-diacylglucosamine diphosphatase [Planctomycetes bacterium]|nr:UDP-2,3-diacylglucosamine diphosphatase [Planctomycetota bacterium]
MNSATVPMGDGFQVIADLHLDPSDESSCAAFGEWLDSRDGLRRLVILGDLFDAWVGPAHAQLEGARQVLSALRRVKDRGGEVELLWGNRDFLLDERVAADAGATLRRDALVGVGEAGERAVFVHGDELCTLDHSYQRLRRILRSKVVTGALLSLPLWFTLRLARKLRAQSERAVGSKAPEEMAMQEDVVLKIAEEAQASALICGHAHRWRDEELSGGVRWIVLDAFGGELDCLAHRPGEGLVGTHSGYRERRGA